MSRAKILLFPVLFTLLLTLSACGGGGEDGSADGETEGAWFEGPDCRSGSARSGAEDAVSSKTGRPQPVQKRTPSFSAAPHWGQLGMEHRSFPGPEGQFTRV